MTTRPAINVGCNACYFNEHVDCTGWICLCDCRSKTQLERARELKAAFLEEEEQRSRVLAKRALDKARAEYDGSDRAYINLMEARRANGLATNTSPAKRNLYEVLNDGDRLPAATS